MKLVRARAAEWHVDPNKVGIVGFSAGAMTVLATVQQAKGPARPDFVGMIYGPTQTATVPANPMRNETILGRSFDPAQPDAYLNSFAIKR